MEPETIEIELLFEAIARRYDYDFRNYSQASRTRRIHTILEELGLPNISQLQHELLYSQAAFAEFLTMFSIPYTMLFRESATLKVMSEKVFEYLETYPQLKVWVAGCASGEELYSLAILLEERGLLTRTQLYGTDINVKVLDRAKKGIYTIECIEESRQSYRESGGTRDIYNYFTLDQKSGIIKKRLRERVLFSEHNLVSDSQFGEMQLICCRNVMIYFNRELQQRVLSLFENSLCYGGFLCIGDKESLIPHKDKFKFETIESGVQLFRKVK